MYTEKPLSKYKIKSHGKIKKYVVGFNMFTKFGSKLVSLIQNCKAMKTIPQKFSFSNSQDMNPSENSHY